MPIAEINIYRGAYIETLSIQEENKNDKVFMSHLRSISSRCHHVPTVYHCKNCSRLFIIKGNDARPLTTEEERNIDNRSMIGIPPTFKVGRGILIPMMNGRLANCRVGDQFYSIPSGDTVQDLLYKAFTNGANPANTDLSTMLEITLPQSACTVDAHRLRGVLDPADWKALNMQYCFLVE